jgi:hypothetical protein
MDCRLATEKEIQELSKLSVRLGNIPFFPGQCVASVLVEAEADEIVGFAAVQSAWHAAGSWMHEDHRRKGRTYDLRHCLENELRRKGIGVYFAIPGNDFEKELFAKYGTVTEHTVQVRHL